MRKQLLLSALFIGAATFAATSAHAQEKFELHLDLGTAEHLTEPQLNIYQAGIDMHARPLFNVTDWLQLGPSVQASYFPKAVDNGTNAGVLWQFGGAVRIQRSHNLFGRGDDGLWSPYINLDVTGAHTGDLWRPMLDGQVGFDIATDSNHSFWFGPYLGYEHLFQTDHDWDGQQLNPHDVNILTVGVSGTFAFPPKHDVRVAYVREVSVVQVPVTRTVVHFVPVESAKPENLELKQHVYFDWDKSVLRWESRDKLDDVVAKLNKFPNAQIHVQGHASPDGQKVHNEQLAAARAEAVRSYLVAHGVDANRLTVDNFGIDVPVGDQKVQENRERSRRVQFEITVTTK